MPFPQNGKTKDFHKQMRGLRLIFQVGGPAFLRSAALFPVVKCVEVSGRFIDRLTKAQNGPNQTLKIQGGSAPFFRNSPATRPGSFLRRPPSHVEWGCQLGKNKLRFALNQQEAKFSTTAKKG